MAETKTFGERLRTAYITAGLTRAEFARRVGVGYNTIWRYEQGKNDPGAEVLVRMANVAGVSVDSLYNDVDNPGKLGRLAQRPFFDLDRYVARAEAILPSETSGERFDLAQAEELARELAEEYLFALAREVGILRSEHASDETVRNTALHFLVALKCSNKPISKLAFVQMLAAATQRNGSGIDIP